MRRALLYFAAFTGMGTLFVLSMVMAALVLGSPSGDDPEPTAPIAQGPIGEITITAFDLGFEPAMAHVAEPGTYTVTFANDGGTFHDVTFADGTVIGAEAHETATGEVTIPAGGMTFICSVPGHADGGMTGEVMVTTAQGSGGAEPTPGREHDRGGDARHRRRGHRSVSRRNRGSGQPDPRAHDPRGRDQAVGADRVGHRVGDRAGDGGRGLRLQRHGPRATAARRRRRPHSDHPAQRAAGADDDPFARAVRAHRTWTGCRSSASPRSCQASRSPTSTPSGTPARTCTTATSWPSTRCRWASSVPSS